MNTDPYPFLIKFTNGATYGSPEQMYKIATDFASPDKANYKALLETYSAPDQLISLVDLISLIIEINWPDLLDHMDFDEEGYELDMHVDSEEALQMFVTNICPIFQDMDQLQTYVRKLADR